jgi:hypothetical protein
MAVGWAFYAWSLNRPKIIAWQDNSRHEFRLLYNLFSKLPCGVVRLQLFMALLVPVGLIPRWWGKLIRLANLADPVVHRIFSSLFTFVVYLAKGTPPSWQVLTLSLIHWIATVA